MNSGLDTWDYYHLADSLSQDDCRITVCPLCLPGPYSELHVLIGCVWLCCSRSTIFMLSGTFLESLLISICCTYNCQSDQEEACFFLGQECGLTRMDFVDRGLALNVLLSCFFVQWSVLSGRASPIWTQWPCSSSLTQPM